MRILWLGIYIFYFTAHASLFESRERDRERSIYECERALKENPVDFLPNHHRFLIWLTQNSRGIGVLYQIADQNVVWATKQHHIHTLIINTIRSFINYQPRANDDPAHKVLDIFLNASVRHGYPNFVNLMIANNVTILRSSIEHNNGDFARIALTYNANLDISCFSNKKQQWLYPLKFACIEFGPQSQMVQLLLSHGAQIKPEDKHLLSHIA